jgi:hypothetical protein
MESDFAKKGKVSEINRGKGVNGPYAIDEVNYRLETLFKGRS